MGITAADLTPFSDRVKDALQHISRLSKEGFSDGVLNNVISCCKDIANQYIKHADRITDVKSIWDVGISLWNAAVELSNASLEDANELKLQGLCALRQAVCDLLVDCTAQQQPEEVLSLLHFQFATGTAWSQLDNNKMAETCLSSAMELAESLMQGHTCKLPDAEYEQEQLLVQLHQLYCMRTQVLLKLQSQGLAREMLQKVHDELTTSSTPASLRWMLFCDAITRLLSHARALYAEKNWEEVLGILEEAQDLVVLVEGAADLKSAGQEQQPEKEAKLEVLMMIGLAHLELGQLQLSQNCVQAVRSTANLPANFDLSASLLAIKVHAALRQCEYIEAEILSLCLSEHADLDACIEALISGVDVNCSLDTVKRCLDALQERFPKEAAKATVASIHAFLGKQTDITPEQLIFVMDLVKPGSAYTKGIKEDPQLAPVCFGLLSEEAVRKFEAGEFEISITLQDLSLLYTKDTACEALIAMSLSVSCLGLQDYARALQYADRAAGLQPGQSVHSYLKFKVHLSQGHTEAAESELLAMIKCEDFDMCLLQVACQEAVSAHAPGLAKAGLQQILDMIQTGHLSSSPQDMSEATISRCIVNLVVDELQQYKARGVITGASPQRGVDPTVDAMVEILDDVSSLLHGISSRVESIPAQKFFGDVQEDTIALNLEWLSGEAWNLGLEALQCSAHQQCTLLMNSCARLIDAHPKPQKKLLITQKWAFLLAAACAINVHEEDLTHEASLQLAARLLEKTKASRKGLAEKFGETGDTALDKSDVYILMQEFVVATRSKNAELQTRVLEQCSINGHITAEHLLGFAQLCKEVKCSQEVRSAAMQMALQKMLASTNPDYNQVAWTVRSLLQTTVADADKLVLYKELCQILAGLKAGSYPRKEATWLVTSCWNRGCHHAKFSRTAIARQYMSAALTLSKLSSALEDKRPIMERELEQLVQNAGQGDQ